MYIYKYIYINICGTFLGEKSPARDTFISDVDRGMSSFDIPLDLEVILTELNRLIGSTLLIVDSECV